MNITCPYCQRTTRQNKAGNTRASSQRYRCKYCNRKYTPKPKKQGYPESVRKRAIEKLLPKHIHAVTAHDFGLKVVLFLLASYFNFL